MSPLQGAIEQIYRLNVGVVGGGENRHERPHKPVLLLTVLEMLDEGVILPDRLEWSADLRRRFRIKFEAVRSANDEPTPENPFFHLKGDGFWSPFVLTPTGDEQPLERKPLAQECDRGRVFARIEAPWAALLTDRHARGLLRESIISRYFPSMRGKLGLSSEPESVGEEVAPARSAAFRRLLLELYDHQCSACGLRVKVPEIEFTLVDAAHLIPFSKTHDDRPGNGVCLCKNHHWAMDQRLLAPTPELTWVVSDKLDARRSRGEGELLALSGKPMLLPADAAYRPLAEGLEWRRGQLC